MKKLLLLCSIIMYCLSANAQSFTANPTTVASGADVTITGSGESAVAYFAVLYSASLSPTSTPVTATAPTSIVMYNPSTLTATSFKMKFTNNTSTAQNVTVWFTCAVNNSLTGGQNTNFQTSVTITVNPAVVTPTIYYSAPYSKSFVKNNCSTGYQGSSVSYSAVSGQFTSAVSQSAADQLAINYVNSGGQANANAHGTCNLLYYNTAISQTFYRNNCGAGSNGSSVLYTVPASKYSSTVSQADANNKAQNDINLNGQNYANTNGTCTPSITYLVGPSSVIGGSTYVYTLPNLPSGYLVKWELIGQGYTDTVDFQVDDNSSSVYFNTMPNGTPNGTATLRATIKNPNSTNPHLNMVAEQEVTITYCTVCP